jgi:hypothetical protein
MGQTKKLNSYCEECHRCRVASKDGEVDKTTGELEHKAGDFIVKCDGIPADDNFIPNFDKIKHKLNQEEIDYAQTLYDPIAWAKKNLNWEPRESKEKVPFQSLMLRCTAKRKVFRTGRRIGKTTILSVAVLHYLFTNSPEVQRYDKQQKKWVKGFSTVLVLAPYLSQIKLIYDCIIDLLKTNPVLYNEVKRSVANPFHCIELYNGAKIVLFPSGAKAGTGAESVRGQKADLIILDEMDYLNEKDLDNVLAMLMEHSDVKLWCASTPSGKREYFWRFCTERMDFKEFYFPSMVNPAWSNEMERELRMLYNTQSAWEKEILAIFGDQTHGVFQAKFVDQSLINYKYDDQHPKTGWVYSLGTDWNDTENGTKLCVVGFDLHKKKFRIVEKETVQKAGWTQLTAVARLRDLNRKWRPKFIYVDLGYGSVQNELIKKIGIEAQFSREAFAELDQNLINVKTIDFGSKVDLFDPFTKEPRSTPMKPYMVNNLVSKYEMGMIETSKYDDVIYKQLLGYVVARVTQNGVPVYESGPDGDHDLDAFMLAMLAFSLELSEFTNVEYSGTICLSGRLGEGSPDTILKDMEKGKIHPLRAPQKPETRIPDQKGTIHSMPGLFSIKSRIYTPEAFNGDDRQRQEDRRVHAVKPVRTKF